jgi:invasion protein IalB
MVLDGAERKAHVGGRRGAAARAALVALALLTAGAGGVLAQQGAAPGEAGAGAAPAPLPPGPRDGRALQDWTLHCRLPQPDQEVCEMRQPVADQSGNRVVLAVVGRLPNAATPGLLILLPLGIALPPGTFFRIDQGGETQLPVVRCERQGCQVELLLDEGLLPQLKAGTRAIISFFVDDVRRQRLRVDVPISLLGFSAALAEVMS